MSAPFNFEDFIAGLTVDLPREQVPLYAVVNQSRIDELNRQIDAASSTDTVQSDERETSDGVSALVRERDALFEAQEASAKWITLRCLTTPEYAETGEDDKDVLDQIAAQTVGTENEMTRDQVEALRGMLQPAAWSLLVTHANRIVTQQLVMPDFSPSNSARKATPTS